MWCVNWGSIFLAMVFRCSDDKSFESFAFQDFRIFSSFGSMITPASIIGPRTGPRPASSIPRSFAMLIKEEKAL